MGRNVDLAISARDNYSSAITKMATTTRSFAKDMDGLSLKLSALNKNKTTLQLDATKAKSELAAAKKQFMDTGNEATRLNMIDRQSDFNNITSNLKLVSDQARQTEKDMRNLTDELSRQQNRADGTGGGKASMLSQIASAGAAQMIGQTVANAADSLVSSGLGETMGGAVNSVISKAATGAAIGSMIAPGVGTAVGAAIGVVAGAVDGAMQVFEKKDDAFKDTVKTSYDLAKQSQKDALTAGSSIAAGRETGLVSWTTLLKSEDKAKAFTTDIKNMANATPFLYADLDRMSKTMKTFGYETENILPTLTNVGDAGAALGINAGGINDMATAIGRMKQSDKTSLEWLNIITDKGVPAVDYLAKALSVSKKEIYDMVSRGLIPGAKAAQIITDAMGESYGGGMEKQSHTFEGISSNLQGAKDELNNSMGAGFNAVRKQGMLEEVDFLSGDAGTKMQEAYGMIGEWQASLVNLAEQYERDAISAVMDGALGSFAGSDVEGRLSEMSATYQSLLAQQAAGNAEAGAKMGALIAEAQTIANSEFMASSGQQAELDANKALINSIQQDTGLNADYYNTGLKLGNELTKGIVAAAAMGKTQITSAFALTGTGGLSAGGAPSPNTGKYSNIPGMRGFPSAWGQERVPYDNYPALLHEGEKVVTASKARGMDFGGAVEVNLYGTTIREEGDIQKFAQELLREISLAKTVAIGG
ncbi:MAG: tape measure protein [Oscillospiraceae bacterium]